MLRTNAASSANELSAQVRERGSTFVRLIHSLVRSVQRIRTRSKRPALPDPILRRYDNEGPGLQSYIVVCANAARVYCRRLTGQAAATIRMQPLESPIITKLCANDERYIHAK